jgi:hypothetical protein
MSSHLRWALCCAGAQVQLDDLQAALRSFTRALTAAVAFLDSRQAGMLAQLDRQAKELLKRVQVSRTYLQATSYKFLRCGQGAEDSSRQGRTHYMHLLVGWLLDAVSVCPS